MKTKFISLILLFALSGWSTQQSVSGNSDTWTVASTDTLILNGNATINNSFTCTAFWIPSGQTYTLGESGTTNITVTGNGIAWKDSSSGTKSYPDSLTITGDASIRISSGVGTVTSTNSILNMVGNDSLLCAKAGVFWKNIYAAPSAKVTTVLSGHSGTSGWSNILYLGPGTLTLNATLYSSLANSGQPLRYTGATPTINGTSGGLVFNSVATTTVIDTIPALTIAGTSCTLVYNHDAAATGSTTFWITGNQSCSGNMTIRNQRNSVTAKFYTNNYSITAGNNLIPGSSASGTLVCDWGSSIVTIGGSLAATSNSGTFLDSMKTSKWRVFANWTYGSAWTVVPGTSDVSTTGSGTFTSAGKAFYDIRDSLGTMTLGDSLTVLNDLTTLGTSAFTQSTFGMYVGGDFVADGSGALTLNKITFPNASSLFHIGSATGTVTATSCNITSLAALSMDIDKYVRFNNFIKTDKSTVTNTGAADSVRFNKLVMADSSGFSFVATKKLILDSIGDLNGNGSNLVRIFSSTPSSQFTLTMPSDTGNYRSVTDVSATNTMYMKPTSTSSNSTNIVFLNSGVAWGDSWVQSYLNTDTLAAKRGLGETWTNRGVSGSSSGACLTRVISDLTAYAPKVATIHMGTNDIFVNSEWTLDDSLDKYVSNMRKIMDSCTAHACTLMVDLISPAVNRQNGPVILYNRYLQDLCIDRGLKMANTYMPFYHRYMTGTQSEGIMDTLYSSDGLHPNKAVGTTFYNNFATKYALPKRESNFGTTNFLIMNEESWRFWLLSSATILGDADTGSLRIAAGQTAISPTLCISTGRYYDTIVLPTYPNCTTYVRVSHVPFFTQEKLPIWKRYTSPILTKSRYMQIKLVGGTNPDTITDLKIRYPKADTETVFASSIYDYYAPVTVNTSKNKNAASDFATQVIYTTTDTVFWNHVTPDLSNVSIIDSNGNKLNRILFTKISNQKAIFYVAANWANSKLRIAWGANNVDGNDIRVFGNTKPLSYIPFDDDSDAVANVMLHDLSQRNWHDRYVLSSSTTTILGRVGLFYRSCYFWRKFSGNIRKNAIDGNWYYRTDPHAKPITIQAVIKRDTVGSLQTIYAVFANPRGLYIKFLANDSLEVVLQNTANTNEIKLRYPPNSSKSDQMITVTYSGSSTAAGFRCWYDTTEQTPTVITDNLNSTTQNGGFVTIGQDYNASTSTLSGNMSTLVFLETAVNDSFVKQRWWNYFKQDSVFTIGANKYHLYGVTKDKTSAAQGDALSFTSSFGFKSGGATVNGQALTGWTVTSPTSASGTIPAVSGSNLPVIAYNSDGDSVSVGTITVTAGCTGPSISAQPAPTTVTSPATAPFSVTATGDAPLSYQWQRNSSNITGATGSSYTTGATDYATDNGAKYRCIIANGCGSVTSNEATLTIACTGAAVSIHPASTTVTIPSAATFSVTATGSYTLAYQWQKNSVNIGGATASSYTTPATSTADNGNKYRCVITNSCGTATSNEAVLTANCVKSVQVIPNRGDTAGGTSLAFIAPYCGGLTGSSCADVDSYSVTSDSTATGVSKAHVPESITLNVILTGGTDTLKTTFTYTVKTKSSVESAYKKPVYKNPIYRQEVYSRKVYK